MTQINSDIEDSDKGDYQSDHQRLSVLTIQMERTFKACGIVLASSRSSETLGRITLPAIMSSIFTTPRLVARRLQSDDLAPMFAVYSDADAMRWVGNGEPITKEECVKWLEVTANNYRVRGYGMFALLGRESGEVVGFCGLVHPDGQVDAEIKYALKRSYWGVGLATEAASAMLAYGAREYNLTEIIATTAPQNVASHRVLLKAGMKRAEIRDNEDGTRTQVFRWQISRVKNAGSQPFHDGKEA